MPYTAKQRRMFNARAKTDPKFKALAEEANSMPVRTPTKKSATKKAAKK